MPANYDSASYGHTCFANLPRSPSYIDEVRDASVEDEEAIFRAPRSCSCELYWPYHTFQESDTVKPLGSRMGKSRAGTLVHHLARSELSEDNRSLLPTRFHSPHLRMLSLSKCRPSHAISITDNYCEFCKLGLCDMQHLPHLRPSNLTARLYSMP